MRLEPAGKNIVYSFARTHGLSGYKDRSSALRLPVAAIKRIGDVLDPFFFFRAVGEHQLQGAPRSGGGRFGAGGRLFLAPRHKDGGKEKNGGQRACNSEYARLAKNDRPTCGAEFVGIQENKASRPLPTLGLAHSTDFQWNAKDNAFAS